MTFEPLPLTVLVRTRSRVATPLARLLDALGVATKPGGEHLTICVCDEGEEALPGADRLRAARRHRRGLRPRASHGRRAQPLP